MSQSLRPATSRWLASVAVAVTFTTSVIAAAPPAPSKAEVWPVVVSAVPKDPRIETRISELLRKLTLEQKVGQMIQADIRYVTRRMSERIVWARF